MGCCTFNYPNKKFGKDTDVVIVPNSKSTKLIKSTSQSHKNLSYYTFTDKEEDLISTKKFPSSLIKSKENPNGIVVIKMKN